jgi:hypothetical protein
MLKFYEIEGRFPAYREQVPQAAVDYLGSLVKVAPALFAKYSWRGGTIEYHRAQIRRAYGTRPPTEADEDRWALSPLFWSHVSPYGRFRLDMDTRLDLTAA